MADRRKMELGIGSYCYPYAIGTKNCAPKRPMTAEQLVDEAVRLKVPVVQIADNYPLLAMTKTELVRLYLYAEKRGIHLETGVRGSTPEILMSGIKAAELLHSSLLRCVLDSEGDEPCVEEVFGRLKKLRPLLEKKGIILGIENHDRFPARVLGELMERLQSPCFGIVLDTVNSFACEEMPMEVMEALGSYTVNFHVKDFEIRRVENAMGLLVTGTPAGAGRLPIPEMLRYLQENAAADFSVILELWMQQEETVDQTIKKEREWVEESIGYLKQYVTNENQTKEEKK